MSYLNVIFLESKQYGLVCESEPAILAFLSKYCWYLDQTNARIQGLTACKNVGLLSLYHWLLV